MGVHRTVGSVTGMNAKRRMGLNNTDAAQVWCHFSIEYTGTCPALIYLAEPLPTLINPKP